MTRFIPPHLMVLVSLLIVVVWIMLLHHFRRSTTMQRFVAEVLGDDTPENALSTFEWAKRRLTNHLSDGELDCQMRRRIEYALGSPQDDEAVHAHVDDHALS